MWTMHAAALILRAMLRLGVGCGPAEPGTIEVDGILEDWRDAPITRPAHGILVRCLHDDGAFYVMVDGLRGAAAELAVGGRRVPVKPGKGGPVPAPAGFRLATTRRPGGWALEAAIPREAARGSAITLRAGAQTILLTPDTGDERRALHALREQLNLGDRAPDFNRQLKLGYGPGTQRLLRFGKYVAAVAAEEYTYFELPLERPGDLKEFYAVDLAGHAEAVVVARYTERGGGGERDLLTVWQPHGDAWRRLFAAETAKRVGAGSVEAKVGWVTRGKGRDLVLEAQPARGLSKETWREAPAADAVPIVLPWSDRKKVRVRFLGDEYQVLE